MALNTPTNVHLAVNTGVYQDIIDGWGFPTISVSDMTYARFGPLVTAAHGLLDDTDVPSRFVSGFRWDDTDQVSSWWPQGLTGTGDAYASGVINGRRFVVTTWHNADDSRSRITLADITNMLAPVPYRHILLVEPVTNQYGASLKVVPIHAGGCTWFGDYLYVLDASKGLRAFDMTQITVLPTNDPTLIGRQADGSIHAYGYNFVIPQVVSLYEIAPFDTTWSYCGLGVDSVGPVLITGKYSTAPGQRLYVWDLDIDSGLITSPPHLCLETTDISLQGVQGINPSYFTNPNLLKRYVDGGGTDQTFDWPNGSEGLTYFPQSDELWTVTEAQNLRLVFSVTKSTL